MKVDISEWITRDPPTLKRQDMLRWCWENNINVQVSDDQCTWWFKKETEVVMFILMWQNRI